jgi:hypothetical protein
MSFSTALAHKIKSHLVSIEKTIFFPNRLLKKMNENSHKKKSVPN